MNEDDVKTLNKRFEERSGAQVPPPRRNTRPSAQTPSEIEHPSGGPGQAEGNGSGPDFHGPHGGAGPNSENPAGQHGPKSATAWTEPPRPLEEYLSPVLSITADMMPEAMGDWASNIATDLRCPLDFPAAAIIVGTGAVLASRVRIRPLHYNRSWEIAPNLWGGIIGPPGSKKSPAMNQVFKMLMRLEADESVAFEKAKQAHKQEQADHRREVKLYRDSIERLRKKQVLGTAKDADNQCLVKLKAELEALVSKEPSPPARRHYRLNDATIESIQDALTAYNACILIDRDELTGMLAQWEMDGRQNDRPFFLESANGTNSYNGKRVTRGDFFVPNLCLSLFGGIQPHRLIQYLRNPKVCLTADGALQRFQVLVYPDMMPEQKLVDKYDDIEAKNHYFDMVHKLAHADFHAYGGQSDQYNEVPWFHFDIPAKERFMEWEKENSAKVRNKDESPLLREHFAKYDKLLCGLALIFHLIELADQRVTNPGQSPKGEGFVPLRILALALRWVECFESHTRRIYGLTENLSVSSAVLLGNKLKDPEVKNPLEPGFTARDVARRCWAGLLSYDDINPALARLEEANWLRSFPIGVTPRGGRPTIGFEIHPSILAGSLK